MDFQSFIRDQFITIQESHQLPIDAPLIVDYTEYLTRYRDLAPRTIKRYMSSLLQFFEWVKCSLADTKPPFSLCPETVQKFTFHFKNKHTPGSCHVMYVALRNFFRFAYHKGYLDHDFSPVVPTIRKRRLSHVPSIIEDDCITALLESIDRSTLIGIRDYAIITLLATYGVRNIQVRKLRLQDINWEKNTLSFSAVKGGNPVIHYLTTPLGNSLLKYIKATRPITPAWSEVFLTVNKPIRPFYSHNAISGIVLRRLRKAEITLPDKVSKGSHMFRHAFATRMLSHGKQFKHIADMLGHKYLDSTFIYTKVDFQMLSHTTLEWPGGKS